MVVAAGGGGPWKAAEDTRETHIGNHASERTSCPMGDVTFPPRLRRTRGDRDPSTRWKPSLIGAGVGVLARLVFGIAAAPLGSGIPQGRQRRAVAGCSSPRTAPPAWRLMFLKSGGASDDVPRFGESRAVPGAAFRRRLRLADRARPRAGWQRDRQPVAPRGFQRADGDAEGDPGRRRGRPWPGRAGTCATLPWAARRWTARWSKWGNLRLNGLAASRAPAPVPVPSMRGVAECRPGPTSTG